LNKGNCSLDFNNHDIVIDTDRLAALPENAVPPELFGVELSADGAADAPALRLAESKLI
jgi:hypothetical protein